MTPIRLPTPGAIERAAAVTGRALAILAAATAIVLIACLPHSAGGGPPPAARSQAQWNGRLAADFALRTLDGKSVRLSAFRGRVVVLNFWASWCGACSVEMPWLAQFDARYRRDGLAVLGIAVDAADREEIARFARAHHANYPLLLTDDRVERSYGGVRVLPQTFFIGRDGRIIKRVYGIRTRGEFEADIRRALGLPPATA